MSTDSIDYSGAFWLWKTSINAEFGTNFEILIIDMFPLLRLCTVTD